MKQLKHNLYPYFSHGEVLTMDTMNNLVGYLDEQQLITRSEVLGYGVIEGLELSWSAADKRLYILKGKAITPSGQIIITDKALSFYLRINKEGNLVLLPDGTDLSEYNSNFSFRIDDYVVLIRHKEEDVRVVKCNQLSCDVQVVRKQIVFQPDFVKKSDLGCGFTTQLMPIRSELRLKKLKNVETLQNVKLLRIALWELFTENRAIITSALSELHKALEDKDSNRLQTIYPDWGARVNHLSNEVKHLKAIDLDKNGKRLTNLPVYYLDFLEDLKDAYNEFADFFNQIVLKYKMFIDRTPREGDNIYLGAINDRSKYRELFRPIKESKEYTYDTNRLYCLFYRICMMIQYFIGYSSYAKKMNPRIIAERPGMKLGDRTLPYYYRYSIEFRKYWKLNGRSLEEMPTLHNADSSTSESQPVGTIFRAQAYYGRDIADVRSSLHAQIEANDIPVNIEFIKLEKSRLSIKKKLHTKNRTCRPYVYYYDVLKNLLLNKSSYTKMAAFVDALKDKDKAQKSIGNHKTSSTLSEMEVLMKLANEKTLSQIIEYSVNLDKRVPASTLIKYWEILRKISPETIHHFCYYSDKKYYYKNIYGHETVAAFAQFKSFIKKTLKLEYSGSVAGSDTERFGTIYFAYYKNKVLYAFSK